MFNRPHYIACALVLVIAVGCLKLPEPAAAKAKQVAGSVFVPLFGLVDWTRQLAQRTGYALIPRSRLQASVDALARENAELRLRLAQADEALQENARLRQLFQWQAQAPWKTRAARVLARDTANWWRTCRIDLGSRDGMKPDLPVVSPEGLVGRTGLVGYASSEVLLIGDPKCRVAVAVRETGECGVLTATASGVLDHRIVDLTHLPRQSLLKPGQYVSTSGLGGLFPAGIPVGTIIDSRSIAYGLTTEARVKLAADTSRLREVMVVIP